MSTFLFSIFSGLLIVFSFLVIFTNHPIFSLLFLVGTFLSASVLLILIECEFIAFIFVTIYVGAIAVLFLFSIMMLDFKKNILQKNQIKFLPAGIFLGIILMIPLLSEINAFFTLLNYDYFYLKKNLNWFDLLEVNSEIEALGKVLYTYCVMHLLLSGIILLVVLFGVVHLTAVSSSNVTNQSNNKNRQILFKQLAKSVKLN